jgi:hypothetical protein
MIFKKTNIGLCYSLITASLFYACSERKSLEPDGKFVFQLKQESSSTDIDSTKYFPFTFGIACDKDERIYVSSFVDHKVYVLDKKFAVINTIGSLGQGPGELSAPAYLTIHNDNLYIVDWGNNRLSVFGLDGKYRRTIKIPLNFRGVNIAVDSKEQIYVANPSSENLITILNQEGNEIASFGEKIDQPGVSLRNLNISLLCSDEHDNIYVVFATHHKVRKYNRDFGLEWEKDYSNFPPMSWHLEAMRSRRSSVTATMKQKGVSSNAKISYLALDCCFYNGKLYVEYAGMPPHGNGIYEIDPANGEIKRIFLFSHLRYQKTEYMITNFCFNEAGEVLASNRHAGQVLCFKLQ